MANLNFKYGKYRNDQGTVNLPVQKSNGTIYITTDEKAMYVDLGNERIRIGQIISITTSEWQALKPPYSQEAFYYITDANAFLKHNGTNWTQINSTSDIKNAIGFLGEFSSSLTNDKSKYNTGDIYALVSGNTYTYYIFNNEKWNSFSNLGTAIINLQSSIANLNTDITDLNELTSSLSDSVGNLNTITGYKGKFDKNPAVSGYTEGDLILVGNQVKILRKNGNNAATWNNIDKNISARIEELLKDVQSLGDTAGTKEEIGAIQKELGDLNTEFTEYQGTVSSKFTEVEDDIADLSDNLTTNYVTNTDMSSAVNTLGDALKGTDWAAGKTIMGAYSAASEAASAASSAATAAATAQSTADTAKNLATGLQTAFNEIKGGSTETLATLNTKITNLQSSSEDLDDKITKLTSDHNTDIASLETSIENLGSALQVADAMVYKGTVSSYENLSSKSTISSRGDTYKATAEFEIGTGDNAIKVYVGDLLVANGDENEDTGYIESSKLTWDHIPSGYVADYNPKLSSTKVTSGEGASAITTGVELKLTSAAAATNAAGDLGKFTISADTDSSLKIKVNANNDIVFGMEWGTF